MIRDQARVVIVGAGMAGAAAAYHLAVRRGLRGVTIVEAGEPIGLTSAMGTEAYRNWWPDPEMVGWMNRSIDLLEEVSARSGEAIGLTRPGYLFVTGEPARAEALRDAAARASAWGVGELRVHGSSAAAYPRSPARGVAGAADGADLLSGALLRERFPFVGPQAIAGLHVRRCGFLSCKALGTWLIEQAVNAGASLVRDRVVGVDLGGGRARGVRLAGGGALACDALVVAVGPHLREFGRLLGIELPLVCELHGKAGLVDDRGLVPADAPLMVWEDPQRLPWSAGEAAALRADPGRRRWLDELPGGAHFRVRGRELLMLWTFEAHLREAPLFPPRFDPDLGEVLIRGLAAMIPGMDAYFGRGPTCRIDGGYYCKAPDNRPLVGPLGIDGAYVIGALSGYGIMGSQAAAELLADHLTGAPLPAHAAVADPRRLDDPGFLARAAALEPRSGQL